MAYLFGREWSRTDLLAHMGDLRQVAGIRLAEWSDGAERGLRIAQVHSGSGLEFTVLLERGMDIGPAAYRGVPLAWISPAGFGHPAYFEPEEDRWLRTFGGGLLVGCGLTYLGAPGVDEGEALGLHGRLSHLPARHVRIDETWHGDECEFSVAGEMRQARLFGENLRLERRITTTLGSQRISIADTVENLGASPSPLMVLYHINLGFPLLDTKSRLVAAPHPVQPRDSDAAGGLEEWMRFQPPTPDYAEQVFYHDLPAGDDGWAEISLANLALGLSLAVRFKKDTLPNLVQWKMMGRGAYALGLEPANCHVEGRSGERARGTLQFLQPGERRGFALELQVSETAR